MKKILFTVIAAGLMSASAIAATIGKVDTIQVDAEGIVKMRILKEDSSTTKLLPLVGIDTKTMTAMLLTAKSSNAQISASVSNIDGTQGWSLIIIQ